jgi:hypothetical protein
MTEFFQISPVIVTLLAGFLARFQHLVNRINRALIFFIFGV